MPSLPQVLHEAALRSASEIVVESGQAPTIRTDGGPVRVGETMRESDLFDALGQVLSPEQQAELAVGNVVEFHIDVESGRWTLITEPTADGIVVRGRLQGSAEPAEVGAPLELPPLEPFEPKPAAGAAPRPARRSRQTRWDLAVGAAEPDVKPHSRWDVDSPTTPSDGASAAATVAPPPYWPNPIDFQLKPPSGHYAKVDDPEIEGGADDLPELITPGLDDLDEPDAAATRMQVRAEPSVAAAAAKTRGTLGSVRVAEPAPTRRDEALAPLASATSPDRRRDNSSSTWEVLARQVPPGTLCLTGARGIGDQLASGFGGAETVVIEGSAVTDQAPAADPGATYVVRVEDPSRWLGFILRRLEEGGRVVVETRALTSAGAMRTLLGVDSGPRADAWLGAHPRRWLAEQAGRWEISET